MDEFDDDCGDLYADLEVQASSAIKKVEFFYNDIENCCYNEISQVPKSVEFVRNNGDSALAHVEDLKEEEEEVVEEEEEEEVQASSAIKKVEIFDDGIGNCCYNEISQVPFDFVRNNDDSVRVNVEEEGESSDSEDELNIVLNDDDGEMNEFVMNDRVSNRGGFDYKENEEIGSFKNAMEENSDGGKFGSGYNLQYKNMRYQTPGFPSGSRAYGSSAASYTSKSVQDESKDDGYVCHLNASQSGFNFSLPRSRTILDVDIDSFKSKPWSHPGANITDYFNFGFNENSWKQYCNRYQISGGRYSCQSSKDLKVGRHEEVSQISGRAIQVRQCTFERQPSTNTWGPLDRDSSVVIQIAVQDEMKEDGLNSTEEGEDQTEADNEDNILDEARELFCFSSASEDELSSLEGDDETSAKSVSEIDHGSCQILDADVVNRGKCSDAAPTDEEMDTERRLSDAGRSLPKPHLNHGDRSPHSVTCPNSHSHRGYECGTYANLRKSSNKSKIDLPNSLPEVRDSRHSTIYQKHNGLDSHYGKRNSYCKTSNSFPDFGDHKSSNYEIDRYMKRPHWKYDVGQNDRKNMNDKKRHFVQKPRLDHKEGRQGVFFDERRNDIHYMESQPHGGSGQWHSTSDRFLDNEGGNQWEMEKYDWQFSREFEDEDLLVQSKVLRSVVGVRDYVEHKGDEHLSYFRREVDSSGWSRSRFDRAFNGHDDEQYTEYDDDRGGCSRSWSRDSQNRPCSNGRQRLQGGSSDRIDQNHPRKMRDVRMRNVDNQNSFIRKRDHEQCGAPRWNDEHYKFEQKENEVLPGGPCYPHKGGPSRKNINSQHGPNLFGNHVNRMQAGRGRFRMTRGHKRGQFFQNSNVIRKVNQGNALPHFRSSVDSHLVGVDRKFSGRSLRGRNTCNSRYEYIDDHTCMKLKTLGDSEMDYADKAKFGEKVEVNAKQKVGKWPGKFSRVAHNEFEDVEEGRVVTEELKERANEEMVEGNARDGNAALDNPKIREILAKMERRRERFNQPIALKNDTEKASPMAVETCNSNPQRPARKRRWDGSATQHMLSSVSLF